MADQSGSVEFRERKRWVFLGLPWTFTVYSVREEMINIRKGFFNSVEDDCYMYKVSDVKLERSFWERMVKLGTVVCYTADVTNPVLKIEHIKNSKAIKEYILSASEEARMKRRTLNTQNIGSGPVMDFDGDGVDY